MKAQFSQECRESCSNYPNLQRWVDRRTQAETQLAEVADIEVTEACIVCRGSRIPYDEDARMCQPQVTEMKVEVRRSSFPPDSVTLEVLGK